MKKDFEKTVKELDTILARERRQDKYGRHLKFDLFTESPDFAFIENFEVVYTELVDIYNKIVNEVVELTINADKDIPNFIKSVRDNCYPNFHGLEDERKYKDEIGYKKGCKRTTRLCINWELLRKIITIFDGLNEEYNFPVKFKEIPIFEDNPEGLFGIELETKLPYTHCKPVEKEVIELIIK